MKYRIAKKVVCTPAGRKVWLSPPRSGVRSCYWLTTKYREHTLAEAKRIVDRTAVVVGGMR